MVYYLNKVFLEIFVSKTFFDYTGLVMRFCCVYDKLRLQIQDFKFGKQDLKT